MDEPRQQTNKDSIGNGEGQRSYSEGPPEEGAYDAPPPGRGGYHRSPARSEGGPPYEEGAYRGGYSRGRGYYDIAGRGRGSWEGPTAGPPEEAGDRPNIAVYPPRDADDAKPSFEVYPPREGSVGPPEAPPPPVEHHPPPEPYEGYDRGRGYYRSPRTRPPFYRGRGRGYEGYEGAYEGVRGRGWVDRGRGWVDRGRGWVDRGRGWVDRGRGYYDRGRGWVDRGRGGWVDRGRGGWVDRGRGGWVDRGRGGWVDRGGRGAGGGWVDRGGGVGGARGGPPGYDRGRGRGRGHIEFDKTGEYMWDDKNSCWKKVPQHWKQQMQEAQEKGQFPPKEGAAPWEPPRSEWGPGGPPGRGGATPGGSPRDQWGPPEEQPVWEEDGWVWDEREQAWRTQRPDGSWEWEWEYEARAAGSDSPQWRADYKPLVDESGRELPRAYAAAAASEDSSDSASDSSTDSDTERQQAAAEKALLKYKKASKKSRAFAEEIEKHRKKLLKVEEKLKRHKERKKKRKSKKASRPSGDTRSPPKQYRQAVAEEGEVDSDDSGDSGDDSDSKMAAPVATTGGAPRGEHSDIFHRPGHKHRDKGMGRRTDPGGGPQGFRDVDYRPIHTGGSHEHNPFGDQDERRQREARQAQAQEAQGQAQWGGDGRGASAYAGGHAAPFPTQTRQEEEFKETAQGEFQQQQFQQWQRPQVEGQWGPPPARPPSAGPWPAGPPPHPSEGQWQRPGPSAAPGPYWEGPPIRREEVSDPWRAPHSTGSNYSDDGNMSSDSRGPPRDPRALPRDPRALPRDTRAPPPPPPTDFREPPREFRESPSHFREPPREFRESPSHFQDLPRGSPRDFREPPREFHEPPRVPPPPREFRGPSRDPPREFSREIPTEPAKNYLDHPNERPAPPPPPPRAERNEPRGTKRKHYDAFTDPRLGRSNVGCIRPAYGNNSDYREYADYFGLEDEAFGEVSLEPAWVRSTPADLYFRRERDSNNTVSTNKMHDIEDYFEQNLVLRATAVRESKPKYEKPCKHKPVVLHSYSDSESSTDDDDVEDAINQEMEDEIERKKSHPERLHEELWFNEPGESNTGPYCRCSVKARKTGIRHGIYPGDKPFPPCDPSSNNWDRLYHYRLSVSPVTNFLLKDPTVIEHDSHEYIFEGFSLFSHYKLDPNLPQCKVVRFNIEYTLHFIKEDPPPSYDIRSIDLFSDFLLEEILELYDLNLRDDDGGCRKFHFMPRYARPLPDNGKEVLSMDNVLTYHIKSYKPLMTKEELARLVDHSPHQWADYVDTVRGSVITNPGMRPSSLRIDQLDKEGLSHNNLVFPKVVHFGLKPSRITYIGNPDYNKAWKNFVKFRHLLTYKPKVTTEDKQKLKMKEQHLMNLRLKKSLKREVTVALDSEDWLKTGFNADVCQHALMLPVLISHLRFHKCLEHLEARLNYKFKNRLLLQYALTHPSYRYGTVNYGTNPDHARNSMFNCGMRCPEFGQKSTWMAKHRKRGINVLIKIMAKMAQKEEQASVIDNYERLEFLGDAVVEFITTVHLYFMLPDAPEGVLASYRSAIVQNQHLTELAKNLQLQDYFLFTHGPDLCHESEIRHALANCFEALMGAVFMDCGIELADRVFAEAFFKDEPELFETWNKLPLHPLQEDEPNGDRHWITRSAPLQKLVELEEEIGIEFDHIRLLARAFTVRNVGYTTLTLGHNQRMEFLGDSVMQLVVSEYVFKHFPDHHEGHLSLLRQCLVNNKTQCCVFEDLAMEQYIITTNQRKRADLAFMKTKEKADLLEAFVGALYVDKGIEWARVFHRVCFFPRLKEFIMLGDWNDPKSRLQQCCLLRRDPSEQTPEMPKYKVLESQGPTNTRVYKVAVYFRGNRLADAEGSSIQQAEMKAAEAALAKKEELFPLLRYHKNFLNNKFKGAKEEIMNEVEIFDAKIPDEEIVPFIHDESEKPEGKRVKTEPKPSCSDGKRGKTEPVPSGSDGAKVLTETTEKSQVKAEPV